MMAHPMHLHGYAFKIIEVNGKKVDGAIRDTILVMPNSSVKVIFDATTPGKWLIHCHTLYHMHTGMMTYIDVIPEKLEI
jgi:FtsP/CotA-like multicopper oxidase with cupredoxin domain